MNCGYDVVPEAVSPELVAALCERFLQPADARRGGKRNALDIGEVQAAIAALRSLAGHLCNGGNAPVRCVRGIVFDKTPAVNWKVAWHQDRTIAVAERHDVAGFGPWSSKDGVGHVEPPAEVLGRMITLRLHLDDCGESNGPLRVIPDSHRLDILSDGQIAALRNVGGVGEASREITLTCAAGDVLAMRPLLLHASAAATQPSRRRVVHLEFSPDQLPQPLTWQWSL